MITKGYTIPIPSSGNDVLTMRSGPSRRIAPSVVDCWVTRANENYFDVICSVSVLEEVPIQMMRDILGHVAKFVRPVASSLAHMTLSPIFPPELANMPPPMPRRVRFGIP